MRNSKTSKSCCYFPQSGPEGYLPAPIIFPLGKKTFAKEKLFWNKPHNQNAIKTIQATCGNLHDATVFRGEDPSGSCHFFEKKKKIGFRPESPAA